MKFRRFFIFILPVFALASSLSAKADETAPELRDVRPGVMLLVDTSGSMERKAGCTCVTEGCTECYPTCTGTIGTGSERNRWANMVEILTGSWDTEHFGCTAKDRRSSEFNSEYDQGYFIPHHTLPLTPDTQDDDNQNKNGIVDVYMERVKFGLMTFDNVGTLTTSDPLVAKSTFQSAAFLGQSTSSLGMYSYGEPKTLTFPGCVTDYMVDLGARNDSAPAGGLISVGLGEDDYLVVNSQVQNSIKKIRPFGGTPIAAILDDVRYYYNNHNDILLDEYISCRKHYVILITDGYPDQDYRDARFDCDGLDAMGDPTFICPYQLPTDIVADLCDYNSTTEECDGQVKGVFVIGFNVDPITSDLLNDMALAGGTEAALFADTPSDLRAKLAAALNAIAADATTRSSPAFVSPSNSSTQGQYQLQTGFQVGIDDEPWTGVFERKRFICNPSTLEPEAQAISTAEGDRFDVTLNGRTTPRNLYTIISGSTAADLQGVITNANGSIALSNFVSTNSNLTPARVGTESNNTDRRNEIISWVHGENGTLRQGKRLGDIYHSSPIVIGPPSTDIEDHSYNLFRQRTEVRNRPTVAYVSTNDGILHAFLIEDYQSGATTIDGGTELWGFIPPMLLPKLNAMVTSRQFMIDSTPVIKDVFFSRVPSSSPDGTAYHTVLVTGFRGGSAGFVAMDVTDPLHPSFLWQFKHPDFGLSYGRPAIGQAIVTFGGVTQERAIALLPGGTGAIDTDAPPGPTGCVPTGKGKPPVNLNTTGVRSHYNCWKQTEGRQLTILDVATGTVLKHFNHTTWNAPVTGTPALFTEEVGTIATKAYVTDIDGIMWRIDFSSPDPSEWSASPFHDIFWDGAPKSGQPAYDAPILSVDDQGHTIILQATGNTDVLDGTAENRVVSLTETESFDEHFDVSWSAAVNWEVRLDPGEVVTGTPDLFNSVLYFGSFQSPGLYTPSLNACDIGQSRIWGVHYTQSQGSIYVSGHQVKQPAPGIEYPEGSGTLVRHFPPMENVIVMGLGVTQRATCYDEDEETDPYLGTRTVVNAAKGGGFQLVALAGGNSERATGQVVGSITRDLAAPQTITRVVSRISSIE